MNKPEQSSARTKSGAKSSTQTPAPTGSGTTSRLLLIGVGVGALLFLVLIGFLLLRPSGIGGVSAVPTGEITPVSSLQASDYHSLAVDPKNPNRVWFGSHDGIQESTDSGRTWHGPVAGFGGDAMNMSMPASDATRVYIAGHDVFKRSTDGGGSWQDLQSDLPGTDIHGLAVDSTDAKRLLAFVVGSGLLESNDGGDHWTALVAQPPGPMGALAIAPGNPATFYSATGLGVMRSQDGGKSWHPANGNLPQGKNGARTIISVPGKPEELYAGTPNGLYRTTDGGAMWQQVALEGKEVIALAPSQSEPLRVYALASDGSVYRLEGATLGGAK